jgi:hypothetical protein
MYISLPACIDKEIVASLNDSDQMSSITLLAQVDPEVARCFFASATIGITYFCLKGGMRHSAAQMETWFRLMVYKGYMGVIAGLN